MKPDLQNLKEFQFIMKEKKKNPSNKTTLI